LPRGGRFPLHHPEALRETNHHVKGEERTQHEVETGPLSGRRKGMGSEKEVLFPLESALSRVCLWGREIEKKKSVERAYAAVRTS